MIHTNRTLYLAIAKLHEEHQDSRCSLEEYLRSLLLLASGHAEKLVLPTEDFVAILSRAFVANVPVFENDWRMRYSELSEDILGFPGWQATIMRQIVDLREMDEWGMLRDVHKFLGITSPRGRRWYNFRPGSYLECAAAGTFGYWEEDETGGEDDPGAVLTSDEDVRFGSANPPQFPRPIFELSELTWVDFQSFLHRGRLYE